MAKYTTPTPCDLAHITAADDCGESPSGIASIIYVAFKNDLESLPRLKRPKEGEAGEFGLGDYSYVEETPGFKFKAGKGFFKWEIKTESGEFSFSSNGQKKGFTQTIEFGFENISPEISSMFRTLNNRKDVFFAIPEGDKYALVYDPDRNAKIDSGGITYASGKTADDDSATTATITLPSVSPKTYYSGTIEIEVA